MTATTSLNCTFTSLIALLMPPEISTPVLLSSAAYAPIAVSDDISADVIENDKTLFLIF